MKLPFFKKKDTPELGLDVAEQMLHHIFEACDFNPSTVPLEVLTSYSNYRRERYSMQRSVIVLFLVLFMLLPILFIASRITLNIRDIEALRNPVYDISVSTMIPVSQIQAEIDGRTVPIQETGSHQYVIQPNANGEMTITVTLLNQQVTTMAVNVNEVDNTRPALVFTNYDANYFYLFVTDSGTGVNYDAIRVTDDDGNGYDVVSYDALTGCVMLDYPTADLNVIIPDFRENELRLRLKPE